MSQIANDPATSGSDPEVVRRFLTLTIVYSLSIILSAAGLYFYVLLPLWLWFAYSSSRFNSNPLLRIAVRLLIVSVILWIAFTVPLFFFASMFAPLAYAAKLSAVPIGSAIVYLSASLLAVGNPRSNHARRIGLAAAVATAAILAVLGVVEFLGIGMTILVGGVWVVREALSLLGLTASVISAVSFIRVAIWSRQQVREFPQH